MNGVRPIRVAVLGSTGSIGLQTLDVARRLRDRVRIVGLAAHRSADLLAAQAREFSVHHVCVADPEAEPRLRTSLGASDAVVHSGLEGLVRVAAAEDADTVVVAVAGAIGIRPTHAAIEAGKQIALASKEVLVASGEATMELAGRKGVAIVPIDSEHSAIFQCLRGADPSHVDRLILTASGGPFRDTPVAQMQAATPEDALNHPTWSMGGLVTINSATLMNKGLEIIEACRLFSLPAARIEVLVHPQSIVHSLVRFVDGSVLAQLGLPDMRLPIQYALLFPDRIDGALPRLDLAKSGPLTFAEPDGGKFPAISVARQALEAGGTMPCVMNAANEAAVDLFLKRLLPFPGIIELVQAVMARHTPCSATYESVLEADAWARREATQLAHDGG